MQIARATILMRACFNNRSVFIWKRLYVYASPTKIASASKLEETMAYKCAKIDKEKYKCSKQLTSMWK